MDEQPAEQTGTPTQLWTVTITAEAEVIKAADLEEEK